MRLTPFTRVPSVALLAVTLATLSGCGGQAPATSSISAKRGTLEVISRSHGCPSNDFRLKASANPATARMLVPAHPTGALICRYLNPEAPGYRGRGLAGVLTVASSAALGRIVARLDALPPYPVRPAPSCPTFGGRSVLILFHYRHERLAAPDHSVAGPRGSSASHGTSSKPGSALTIALRGFTTIISSPLTACTVSRSLSSIFVVSA